MKQGSVNNYPFSEKIPPTQTKKWVIEDHHSSPIFPMETNKRFNNNSIANADLMGILARIQYLK